MTTGGVVVIVGVSSVAVPVEKTKCTRILLHNSHPGLSRPKFLLCTPNITIPFFSLPVIVLYLYFCVSLYTCPLLLLTPPVTYLLYHPERHLLLTLVATLSDWLHPCINIFKEKIKK